MNKTLSVLALCLLTTCSAPRFEQERLQVAASTPIIADIASNIAGGDADVHSVMPATADPHIFEPRLSSIRTIANADVVLSNGLLLEQQSLGRALEANTKPGALQVVIGQELPKAGGYHLPLIEKAALDTVWLGFRVEGERPEQGHVELRIQDAQGPGFLEAFITGTFGAPERLLSTKDTSLVATLPENAHTHVSWAFEKAGEYELELQAAFVPDEGEAQPIATQRFRFVVGVAPQGLSVLDQGHEDITVNLDTASLGFVGDQAPNPDEAVIAVPAQTLQLIPPDPAYRFLGRPQQPVYLLHQAVLGKHVHGDVDPHFWLDPSNARAMAQIITQALSTKDPANAAAYAGRQKEYIARLDEVEARMHEHIDGIAPAHRHLLSTHDGFGYLAQAMDLEVAGVVPTSVSPRDVAALQQTLRDLEVPAVFIDPREASRSQTLESVAHDQGVEVCTLHSDALGEQTPTYLTLLEHNASTLEQCLG
ncbi:anchored repeat ABC transporter, substrate-binding protein [Corynebacterium pseudopelargi]|uniref:Manganese ABC transporter substrate-binding lipoprotein n=1 Tax=Corynebacterium pseudopelargi TaxID=2080757 RepID=A0A3G6IS18_9CORY|nr:anchored repeat ABC transporter, substrate-binding protein [Corynebacterium pseudopelargi]AZA08405.1 Manganese ABC transporter substrate-binding lipoprotein precursor [Corynebacterium pseudopelargi]